MQRSITSYEWFLCALAAVLAPLVTWLVSLFDRPDATLFWIIWVNIWTSAFAAAAFMWFRDHHYTLLANGAVFLCAALAGPRGLAQLDNLQADYLTRHARALANGNLREVAALRRQYMWIKLPGTLVGALCDQVLCAFEAALQLLRWLWDCLTK